MHDMNMCLCVYIHVYVVARGYTWLSETGHTGSRAADLFLAKGRLGLMPRGRTVSIFRAFFAQPRLKWFRVWVLVSKQKASGAL